MIPAYLKEKQILVEAALEACLPPVTLRPSLLHEAMHYGVLNGGKRIRPILCLATAELFGVAADAAMLPALSLELYHCSTLIHDDLPSMDDDDLRRGQPTCHIKFGEANAILTGDALLVHAFHVLAEHGRASLLLELSTAAGSQGVIAGQVEDLAAEGLRPNEDMIEFIHLNKTASLIRMAIRIGAMVGNAMPEQLETLSLFGEKIGLAFQIADDILDETSTAEILGKPSGSDHENLKMTYPTVYGLDASRKQVEALTNEALCALDSLSLDTHILREIAQYLVARSY